MQQAFLLAQKAFLIGEVPVGAVVVLDGNIIGKGYNLREKTHDALAHAEVVAIKNACENLNDWQLVGADIYITLEPCPMCAGAIINSRINNVYFGAYDKISGCAGSLTDLFSLSLTHKPVSFGGIMENESAEILKSFFAKKRTKV